MMTIAPEKNVSLKAFNTFGIDVKADFFASFNHIDAVADLLSQSEFKEMPRLVLGGGSNMLFTQDYKGIVLRNQIPGVELIDEDADFWYVKAGAGVVWHQLVLWCIEKGYQGIENLSLIPGSAGAAPIQNIGAYGVELKDSFHSLEAFHVSEGNILTFTNDQCQFGYRDSIFKRELKGKVIILSVVLRLRKHPQLNISYGAITQELKRLGVDQPNLKSISDAVCNIRRSKLPDPSKIGNAGSFFKNPEISANEYAPLKREFPEMVAYELPDGNVKLAAGWLIEQCGWKGKVVGQTGSHKDQALVLVNYGGATGSEIKDLAYAIQASVQKKFHVTIEPEVNIL